MTNSSYPMLTSQQTEHQSRLFRKSWLTGPGILVAVGYIDPGNWATDIAAGSFAGYTLLSVVLFSSLIAMILQIMSARLGIATGKDLAELTREQWPRLALPLWAMAELTIISTDLAEVIGSAIALQLLFSMPIMLGVCVTVADVFLLLWLQQWKTHLLTRLISSLLFVIACGFLYELFLSKPILGDVLQGFIPKKELITDPQLLFLGIGIIGATIMPHNLYLHSNLVVKDALHFGKKQTNSHTTMNTIISLSGAMLLNSALVILAASVFHIAGYREVADLHEAHKMISPILGTNTAGIIFGLMLLASGQSATITGTLAGQIIMEGFLKLKITLWIRRLITRGLALIPALLVIIFFGEHNLIWLLVGSQVFLSLQLPFAMISLLLLASDKNRMGLLVNSRNMRIFGWIFALVIIIANGLLLESVLFT